MKAVAWLSVVAAVAACMPERRPEDAGATVGEDGGGPDGAGLGQDATATDAVGDAKSDAALDAKPADVVATRGGCKGDGECQGAIGSPCHQAKCVLATGLCEATQLPNGTTCTDAADKCAVSAACQNGACLAKDVTNCDDANPCTQDECKLLDGCVHTGAVSFCNDGNPCTFDDACEVVAEPGKPAAGKCTGKAKAGACDDFLQDGANKVPVPCTLDSCDPVKGCVHEAADASTTCDDGKKCTENDHCVAGACTGSAKVCPDADKNPCTLPGCAPGTGACAEAQHQGGYVLTCDDGNACSSGDQCAGDKCAGKDACDDQNPCTQDACDLATGCTHTADTNATCTSDDVCQIAKGCGSDGQCQTAPKDCDDGNACTDDACLTKKGCTHVANSAACSDGEPCTENDGCAAGVCSAGEAPKCDDGDPCTDDTCTAGKGCTAKPSAAGTACKAGGNHECVAGACVAKADCGDGLCALAEDPSSCASDCPAAGGACAKGDAACIAPCQQSKCATQKANCDKDGACVGLAACVSGATDAKGEQACFAAVGATSIPPFLSLNQCSQAFCVQDAWIGKKCKGGGPVYTQCVDACESAMCKIQWAACYATKGCPDIRACLQACPDGDVKCIGDCKQKGTAAELQANGDLDLCSTAYCQ